MTPKKNSAKPFETHEQNHPARPDVLSEQNALNLEADRFECMFYHSIVPKTFSLLSGEITANQAFYDMLGYSRAELQGKKWQEITHPDDLEASQTTNKSLQSGEKDSVRVTKRYLHKSGAVVWADVSTCVRLDEAGRVLYFMTEINDITERHQAEEALRLSEEKWRSLVSASPDYIAMHDSEGHYLFLNHFAEGFSEKDVIGASLYDYLLPESVPIYRSAMEKVLQTGTIQHFEMNGLGDHGFVRIYENYIVPMHGKDHAPHVFAVARDITDRKQAEQALTQSHARYQQLFENSGTGVIIADEDGRYILVNNVAAQKFGTTPDQMVGKNVFDFLTRDQAGHYLELNRQLLLSGCHREYEDTFQLPTGEHTFLIIDQCLQDEQGRNFAVQSSSIDITERKQAEQALQASEQKLRTLFDTMSEGVALNQIMYDENGEMVDFRILEVNQAFDQIADFIPGQVVGNVATKLYGMSLETIQEFWRSHMEATAPVHTEFASPLSHKTYYICTSPFRDDSFVTTFVDITDFKQKEASLRESEERLRSIFASSPNSITVVDLKGNITLGNQAAAKIHGFSSPEQMVGISFFELVAPEDRTRAVEAMQLVMQQGMLKDVPFTGLKRNGETFAGELSVSIIKESQDNPPGFVGITKDVTARKQAEETLHQKMEELERFQSLTVGRELRMIEMKKEINALLAQSGQPAKYPLPPES